MRALKKSYFVAPNLIRGLVTTDFIRTCPDENQDAESSGLCLASHQHDTLRIYRLSQSSQMELCEVALYPVQFCVLSNTRMLSR